MSKLRNCILGAIAAVSFGTCTMPDFNAVESNEKLEQDFKSYARQCGIEQGLNAKDAMDCLVQYVNSNLYGKTLTSTGAMQEDQYGTVRDIDMYYVNINDMKKSSNSFRVSTSVQPVGSIIYPDGVRSTSRITINKDEIGF